MNRSARCILFLAVFLLFLPAAVSADTGPKPSLDVVVSNLPDEYCYLDLLIDKPLQSNLYKNIKNPGNYITTLYNMLKDYDMDGWHAAMVNGTAAPIFGDIVVKNIKGKATLRFSYNGTPDRFKIIVVSSGGTVVSNIIERKAFNSTVYFDYKTGKAAESSISLAYLLQFLGTCAATLIIEGLILLCFGFSLKLNWKPFLLINAVTQLFLTIIIMVAMYFAGTFFVLLLFIPCELLIFIAEAVLFARFLKQHSVGRRIAFALTANTLSFIFSFAAVIYIWYLHMI